MLKEEVTFDHAIVTSRDWIIYPILTFPEVPEIEVVIVNRPDLPAKGISEPVTVPVAAAVANAIYDAAGVRVRDLPITRERLAALLSGRRAPPVKHDSNGQWPIMCLTSWTARPAQP